MRITLVSLRNICGVMLLGMTAHASDLPDVAEKLAVIAQVGPNGTGSAAAKQARDDLAERGIEILPQLLVAMDTSNVIAANWLRTVYEPLVEKCLADSETKWPAEFLREYVSDSQRRGRPRELALAILDKLEPKFRDEWIATRLDDPHFRYQAVAATLAAAETALSEQRQEAAIAEFQKAFQHARDAGQVTQTAAKLKSLGEPADVAKQLGLIIDWQILGPFDAPAKTGYASVFPPEEKLDLAAAYPGQAGTEIRWMPHQTKDVLGTVNLIEALGTVKEAVGFGYAEIDVAAAGPAQIRCGADDNCTIWLNGERVFGRDQWLNGTRFDRFITPVMLVKGRNTVLVKICQGPQHRDPDVTNNWTFQVRLCDDEGAGVAFETRR